MPIAVSITHDSATPVYRQIIEQIRELIVSGGIKAGDQLPSVNEMISELKVSRDTVFKAYSRLKEQGLIRSIPGKGYHVRASQTSVMLFLDRYSPFKEGLYSGMRAMLPDHFSIDLYFHHYNEEVFERILRNALGQYHFFVVMSFDHPRVPAILKRLDSQRLLILDVTHRAPKHLPRIYQDFDDAFYACLTEADLRIQRYDSLFFILPPASRHPNESVRALQRYGTNHGILTRVLDHLSDEYVQEGRAFVVVSDNDLVRIIELARERNLTPGKDIGIISYNDTPVKKVIAEGITVISTDFFAMGQEAARFLMNPSNVQKQIETRLIVRNSL